MSTTTQHKQAAASAFESTTTRRERNLDHWDAATAAAYLGLHPVTFEPLPKKKHAALQSSESDGGLLTSSSTSSSSSSTSSLTDEYIGHDAAILFYAQWCRNCHAVAPSWDAIATHLNAGTKSSNLIMALFDCEKSSQHTQLCLKAGIVAYPTIMYVGRDEYHDTDFLSRSILGKDKSAGPYGATTLPRTVKFQGNWQYPDQILDWISIMKGISSWSGITSSGPLRTVRNLLFKLLTGGKYNNNSGGGKSKGGSASLPVGIPPNFQSDLRGLGSSGGGAAAAASNAHEIKDLEQKLNATTKEKELYEKAVKHSSQLLNSMLFPTNNNKKEEDKKNETTPRDPFTILTNSDGWYQNATSLPKDASNNDEHPSILRSCTLELSIDYCSRITTRETNAYLNELAAIPDTDPFPSLQEIETHLLTKVKEDEPYCGIIENCIISNFEDNECRPQMCPFVNDAACTYVTSCFDGPVQDEYGLALGLIVEGETVMEKDFSSSSSSSVADVVIGDDTARTSDKAAGVGGWGVPAT